MQDILNVLIRAVVSILVLLILARLEGGRLISQLTFYDYVIGISIGSIAATMAVDTEIPMINSILAMVIYMLLTIFISYLTSKSIIARRLLTGESTILIDNGKIVEKNLKRVRFDINDMLREIRSQGYFNVNDIQCAILETSGAVSVLPKPNKRPIVIQDMGLNIKDEGVIANVIIDGKIMKKNLKQENKSEKWLMDELKRQGKSDIKNILLATLDKNSNVQVFEKNDGKDNSTIFQ